MRKSFLLPLLLLSSLHLVAAGNGPTQPVYVYLYTRIDDHINTDLSAERLKRSLQLVEGLQKKHPEAGASLLVQFSGAMAQVLSDQNAKSGLADLIRKYKRSGLIETGYHGANEPAYNEWPKLPDMRNMSPSERWHAREDLIASFLNDYRDPLTGKTDPKRPGGLREVQQVFGPVSAISEVSMEVGGDPEVVHQLRRTHDYDNTIIFGLPNPSWDRHIVGYRDATAHFALWIAPQPNMSPEIFWQDDVLRTSDFSAGAVRGMLATEGVDAMKKVLADLDRAHTHVLHIELSPENLYLTEPYSKGASFPPVRYGYAHPESPRLPQDALRPKEEVEAAYHKQEELLDYLAAQVFPANAGSRFVSSVGLLKMTPPASGIDVKMDAIKLAAASLLNGWMDNHPPDFAVAGDRYFSMADLFQLLVTAFAEKSRTGKFPESVRLHHVYGPLNFTGEFGNNIGSVTDGGIARFCAGLEPKLNSQEWSADPINAVPYFVLVEDQTMNAGSFMHILAQAVTNPQPRYDIHIAFMEPMVSQAYPRTRQRLDSGTTWTLKPAPLYAQ